MRFRSWRHGSAPDAPELSRADSRELSRRWRAVAREEGARRQALVTALLAEQAAHNAVLTRMRWDPRQPRRAVIALAGGPRLLVEDLGQGNLAGLAEMLLDGGNVRLDWVHRYVGPRSYALRFSSDGNRRWTFGAKVSLVGPTPGTPPAVLGGDVVGS